MTRLVRLALILVSMFALGLVPGAGLASARAYGQTPDLTQLTYAFVVETYLQDLEDSSSTYKKLLAATSISVEERRRALEEFMAWWDAEKAAAAYHEQTGTSSAVLMLSYFDPVRRARLAPSEAKRVWFLELILRHGYRDQVKFALKHLARGEFDTFGRPLEFLPRLKSAAESLKLLMRDEAGLPAAAAMANLVFDLSYSEQFDEDTRAAIREIALDLLHGVQAAIKRSEGIDLLAPQNLVGGAVVARLAAPFLVRSLTWRFVRLAWWKTPPSVKVPLVAGTLAAGAGLSQMKFPSRRRAMTESEAILLHRSEGVAVSRRR